MDLTFSLKNKLIKGLKLVLKITSGLLLVKLKGADNLWWRNIFKLAVTLRPFSGLACLQDYSSNVNLVEFNHANFY